jgi:hypothetical protein
LSLYRIFVPYHVFQGANEERVGIPLLNEEPLDILVCNTGHNRKNYQKAIDQALVDGLIELG